MNFELDKDQIKKLDEWKAKIKDLHGEYGLYKYCFEPNGIGDGVTVYSLLAKISIDLTDVDKW